MPVSHLTPHKKPLTLLVAALLILGLVSLGATLSAGSDSGLHAVDGWQVMPALAAADSQSGGLTNANCIMCHQDKDLNGYTRDSLQVNLTINEGAFNQSIHGQAGVLCVGCHVDFSTYPHSDVEQVTCEQCHVDNATILVSLPYDNGRAMEAHFNQTCGNCHADVVNAKGIHSAVAASGQVNAPLCTDCHGSHEMQAPNVPPQRVNAVCSRCHTGVYQDFQAGNHNAADPLTQTCADCHTPHEMPAAGGEVVATPEPTPGCCERQPVLSGVLEHQLYDVPCLSEPHRKSRGLHPPPA